MKVEDNNPSYSPDQQAVKHPLTEEQSTIINVDGNIKINAVAGSGKTTTIIEYAAAKDPRSKILYLAFNKSVKLEAIRKFADKGLQNVTVETAHSLAFRHIMRGYKYQVKSRGYKTHEIAELLGLRGDGGKHTEYIIANHISKFMTYFCNSDKQKVQDLNYLNTITDPKAKNFVRSFYKHIENGTRQLLAKMDKGEIEITHDFYLKKFQLSDPVLPYDYILFDEGQDASAAMLDVFLKQKATKLIVGDTHQQIYGWRHAVNSLEKADFKILDLSASFRFRQDIADLATEILKWKNHLFECKPVSIRGKGIVTTEITKATLARTNLGLLLNAINFITDNRRVKHIYFEGNISSYTYADDGASLYDILNLSNYRHDLIRDKLIKSMNDLDDLEEYIDKTEDGQLAMMVEIVKEYGNEIPGIIKSLKELHTGDENRNKAKMIFSTVHRAKGMEYDVVYLVNDFINESKLQKTKSANKEAPPDIPKLNEEINLLYVAITRTRNKLHIPETLMPKVFRPSPDIHIIKIIKETEFKEFYQQPYKPGVSRANTSNMKPFPKESKEKAYTVSQKRESHKDAYKPWTQELDKELIQLFEGDSPISAIADHFGRTKKGAIISRLKKINYFAD